MHAIFDIVFRCHFLRLFGELGAKSEILGPLLAPSGVPNGTQNRPSGHNGTLKTLGVLPNAASETDVVRRGSLGDILATFWPIWLHFGSLLVPFGSLLAPFGVLSPPFCLLFSKTKFSKSAELQKHPEGKRKRQHHQQTPIRYLHFAKRKQLHLSAD